MQSKRSTKLRQKIFGIYISNAKRGSAKIRNLFSLNIGSIHWYNRRKVTKENQKAYCLVMGLGTLIIGVTLIAATIVQVLVGVEQGAFVILGGVVIGFALMLYAQFKYNKGLF